MTPPAEHGGERDGERAPASQDPSGIPASSGRRANESSHGVLADVTARMNTASKRSSGPVVKCSQMRPGNHDDQDGRQPELASQADHLRQGGGAPVGRRCRWASGTTRRRSADPGACDGLSIGSPLRRSSHDRRETGIPRLVTSTSFWLAPRGVGGCTRRNAATLAAAAELQHFAQWMSGAPFRRFKSHIAHLVVQSRGSSVRGGQNSSRSDAGGVGRPGPLDGTTPCTAVRQM